MFNKLKQLFSGKNRNPQMQDGELKQMVQGIYRLSSMTTKDVMVPRVDVIAIDDSLPTESILTLVANSMHSRFPVYHDTIDSIIGMVYVKDLLKVAHEIEQTDLSSILRHPFFVPETMRLDILLHEMKKRRIHIAVVVDEYGGVSGVACLEDIIEEIVGEIRDEFDNENEQFIKMGKDSYLIDGRLPISKFNSHLSLSLPEDEYDTIGGFVYGLLGRIPVCFEKITYDDTVEFIIQTMLGNKIKSIKVVIDKYASKN